MGTYYIDTHGTSQLRDANEANPSADDGNFTNWPLTSDFILIHQVSYSTCNKTTESCSFKLQFSKDGGAWTDVGSATEISYTATTTLVDGANSVQRTASGSNVSCASGFQAGRENEGDNAIVAFVTTNNYWSELHWALSPASATAGSTYTFRCVNVTNSNTALSGTIASSVTIASGATEVPVYDAVTTEEFVSVVISDLAVSVYDATTVSESVTADVIAPEGITPSVVDSTAVSEDVTVSVSAAVPVAGFELRDSYYASGSGIDAVVEVTGVSVTAGDVIVVGVSGTSNFIYAASITDTASNTYTIYGSSYGSSAWAIANTTGTITITVNSSTGGAAPSVLVPVKVFNPNGGTVSLAAANKTSGAWAATRETAALSSTEDNVLAIAAFFNFSNRTLIETNPLLIGSATPDVIDTATNYLKTFWTIYSSAVTSITARAEVSASGGVALGLLLFEYAAAATAVNISVNDSTGLTEVLTSVTSDPAVSINDTPSISESVSVSVILESVLVSVSDSVEVVEDIAVLLSDLGIVVNDTTEISEYASVVLGDIALVVYDALEVSESVTASLFLDTYEAAVSDEVSLVESAVISLSDLGANTNDAVEISESSTAALSDVALFAYDEAGVSEDVTASLFSGTYAVNVYDTVSAEESVNGSIGIDAFAYSEVGVIDAATVELSDLQATVFSGVEVTEYVGLSYDDLAVSVSSSTEVVEDVNITVAQSSTLLLSVNSNVAVTESADVALFTETYTIAVNDSVTVEESIVANATGDVVISVEDGVVVSEISLAQVEDSIVSVVDLVLLTEDVSAVLDDLIINTYDSVELSEVISNTSDLALLVFDAVVVEENAVAAGINVDVVVFDAASLAESVVVSPSEAAAFEISVVDTVSSVESVTAVVGDLLANVLETVSIEESVTLGFTEKIYIYVRDVVSVSEYTEVSKLSASGMTSLEVEMVSAALLLESMISDCDVSMLTPSCNVEVL